MYHFTDFSNYEPEFGCSDKIIISVVINDLTRKRLTPEQICDDVLPQLRKFSALYRTQSSSLILLYHHQAGE